MAYSRVSSESLSKLRAARAKQESLRAIIAQPISSVISIIIPSLFVQMARQGGLTTFGLVRILDTFILRYFTADTTTARMEIIKTARDQCWEIDTDINMASKTIFEKICPQLVRKSKKIALDHGSLEEIKNLLKQFDLKTHSGCAEFAELMARKFPSAISYINELRKTMHQLVAYMVPLFNLQEFKDQRTAALTQPNDLATQSVQWYQQLMPTFKKVCYLDWQETHDRHVRPRVKELLPFYNSTYTLVLTIASMIIKKIFVDALAKQLLPKISNTIPNIDHILTEEDAKIALRNFAAIEQKLENNAAYVKKLMRYLTLAALPIFIYLLFIADFIEAEYATLMTSLLSVSTTNLLQDINQGWQQRNWLLFIGRLADQIRSVLEPLKVKITIYDQDSPQACEIRLMLDHNSKINLARTEQYLCLTAVLALSKIDFIQLTRYCVSLVNVASITVAKCVALKKQVVAQVQRREQIYQLEKQLAKLDRVGFNVIPLNDATGLPSLRCEFYNLAAEVQSQLQNLFSLNKFQTEENMLIMEGYMPAAESDVLSYSTILKDKVAAVSTSLATSQFESASDSQLAKRRLAKTSTAVEELTTIVRQVRLPDFIIAWPSGKCFSSEAARQPSYCDQLGAVIPISSPYIKANSHFICFDLMRPDFDNEDTYQAFLSKFKEARLVARQAEQGLVFCDEPRSCWQYTWRLNAQERLQAIARQRLKYQAKAKLKLLGKRGDMRCYALEEKNKDGKILLHIVEFEPDAH